MDDTRALAAIKEPGSEPRDRVILALRVRGTLTRAAIARHAGLARSTVSEVVADLKAEGLVLETTIQRTGGHGRPGIGLTLNPAAGSWVGIDFGYRHVRAVLVDVSHTILAARQIALGTNYSPEAGFDAAHGLVNALLVDTGRTLRRVVGIGAAVPGPVDPASGEVLGTSMVPTWSGVDVGRELSRRLGQDVHVENDSNCGLLAEYAWGAGQAHRDVAYIKVHSGVGGGVIIGGQLVRGMGGLAGEFGHITVDPVGPLCACGGRGCFETYAGIPALLRALAPVHGADLTFSALVDLAESGDRPTRRVLEDQADVVGQVAATVSSIISPEAIILGGATTRLGVQWHDDVARAFARHSIVGRQGGTPTTSIVLGTMGEHASALGAVVLLLSSVGASNWVGHAPPA